mgnify:CR=1 FL=1
MRVDTGKNTEADLLIPGNILHAGLNIISDYTSQDKLPVSQEVHRNLLISTNETDYDCKFGIQHDYHCGVQSSSAIVIWLPNNITGISHFHQINSSHIVVIPLNQNCLRIFERTFDKLTTKDTIGHCNLRGKNDGSNPLFMWPSQSLSDNRNSEILYVIDQHNKEIRMVNIADRMAGTLELQLRFAYEYSRITQAENATFYISMETSYSSSSTNIMSLDLIPPKNGSSKYLLTFNRLRFHKQVDVTVFPLSDSYFKVRQMTWISNNTLIITDKPPRFRDGKLLKFLNFSAQTHGYINMNSQLFASFAIDKNLSHHYFGERLIFYTWFNDSVYITSLTSLYRLTRQQMQLVISNQDHNTEWVFYWQTSKYL